MKTLLSIALLALAACSPRTVPPQTTPTPPSTKTKIVEVAVPVQIPVTVKAERITIPELPAELQRSPAPLPDLIDGTMKGVMRDGAQTDSMYNDLSARYRALVRTYNCVRKAVNEQDEKIGDCLLK